MTSSSEVPTAITLKAGLAVTSFAVSVVATKFWAVEGRTSSAAGEEEMTSPVASAMTYSEEEAVAITGMAAPAEISV
jgi:hypothetical protein